MENKNEERIDKLTQQQLIDSILNKSKIEHEALVEVAKKTIDDPQIDINKEKNRIKDEKLKEIENKNNEEIKHLQHKILEEEVEIELQKINEEERIQAEKRRIETDRILKELEETRKKREKLERKEREIFRKKQKQKEKKRNNFLEQIKKVDITELKNKVVPKKNNEINNKKSQLYNITNNTLILDRTKYEKNNNIDKSNKGIVKEKVGNAKKLALKMQKAIQRYVSTMEFYERNKHILQRGRENNTSYSTKTFNKRKSFMEYLTAAVDHKQAIKNVENKKNARSNIRPRIID